MIRGAHMWKKHYKTFLTCISIFSFVSIYYLYSVSIDNISVATGEDVHVDVVDALPWQMNSYSENKSFVVSCFLKSKVEQTVLFNIKADDEIISLTINQEEYDLSGVTVGNAKLTDIKYGYYFPINLSRGKNKLKIVIRNFAGGVAFDINRKFTAWEYLCFYLLLFLPVFFAMFRLSFRIIDYGSIKSKALINSISKRQNYIPLFILLLGILLRICYVYQYDYESYNHDHAKHMEYINYIADNMELPSVGKGVEFPQQPLYYVLSALVVRGCKGDYSFQVKDPVNLLVIFSCLLSILSLFMFYKLCHKVFRENVFQKSISMGTISLTPSFIFMAGRVNNDNLIFFLAVIICLLLFNFMTTATSKGLYQLLIVGAIGLISKISFALWFVVIGFSLLWKFLELKDVIYKKWLFKLCLVFSLVFGLTLWRAYIPSEQNFCYIHSGIYSDQQVTPDLSYFTSFKAGSLMESAQAFGDDRNSHPVNQSFLTNLYATMFFGEYDYKRLYGENFSVRILMQSIYLFGLIVIATTLAILFKFHVYHQYFGLLSLAVLINFILIIKLVWSYPSVCNTDFRYFAPTIAGLSLIIGYGASQIVAISQLLGKVVYIFFSLLFSFEVIWFIWLLCINKPNSLS